MKKNKWVWASVPKDGFLGELCRFLSERNLDKDDFIEIKDRENDHYKFYIYKLKEE